MTPRLAPRILTLAILLAPPVVRAQGAAGASALTALERNVQKTSADWQILARDLDSRVARMLPCDPRAKAAIDEVSRASQARLTALTEYHETAQALASTRAEGARRLLASEEARVAMLADEQSQATAAAAAVNAQIAALSESLKQASALAPADVALRQAADTVQKRNALAKDSTDRHAALLASLRELVAAYSEREAALKERLNAFETERGRWNGYYAARTARSQTECAVTNPAATIRTPAPAAPKPPATTPPPATKGKAK